MLKKRGAALAEYAAALAVLLVLSVAALTLLAENTRDIFDRTGDEVCGSVPSCPDE